MSALNEVKIYRRHDRRGFTLLEAMIGLMVFSIGVLGMLKFQAVSINSNSAARTSSVNTNLGVSTVERLFALNWNENGAQATPELCGVDDNGFETCWLITEGPGPGINAIGDDKNRPAVRLITVRMSFFDQSGTRRSTTLRLMKPKM
jgi:prepilin-type N-terminal cleavage/methylation domain-containing protein